MRHTSCESGPETKRRNGQWMALLLSSLFRDTTSYIAWLSEFRVRIWGEHTPFVICARRLLCFFSSSMENTLSSVGLSLNARYQSDRTYGERAALMRLRRSILSVRTTSGPIRAIEPVHKLFYDWSTSLWLYLPYFWLMS